MSSLRRVYKQFEEQQKRLLEQHEELVNLEEGGGGDEAFAMEEDEDDDHRRQKASHSHRVMEAVGQIGKPRRAANFDRKRERRDQVDEIARMGKTTILKSLMRFCSAIETLYTNEYLRKPTPRDKRRLLRKGAHNDLNVITQSPVFDKLLQGKSPRWTYWVNVHKCKGPYYLADGIYPRWSTFVKTVPHLQSEKEKHFAKCQEGCRKDMERCFGILQARWAIVRATTRMFDVEDLRSIMMTCIILHNMIVEDGYDYDAVDEYKSDSMNNSRTRIYCAHGWTEDPEQHELLQQDRRYNELIVERYTSAQEPYWHITRQNDLIEHQWGFSLLGSM
ncbi:uncharacterized protein [Malus domestica]|uniref:uncharacterized protein n=1 Tax=Malus domestica TaxID=3750 RepID=UPI0039759350